MILWLIAGLTIVWTWNILFVLAVLNLKDIEPVKINKNDVPGTWLIPEMFKV
ncbi:MAG: hypothetical protein NUV86_03875 [Candidatus Scalindua sp.]|nr:hypothetical protein [Candidatus Scalindua sp.]